MAIRGVFDATARRPRNAQRVKELRRRRPGAPRGAPVAELLPANPLEKRPPAGPGSEELFDTGVNCGMPTVKRFLQRTLNVLNVNGTRYPDLVVDGLIGPRTMAALKRALAVAPWYRLCILRALDSLQCVRYIELAERNEKFESFVPGWLRVRVGAGERHGRDADAATAAAQS